MRNLVLFGAMVLFVSVSCARKAGDSAKLSVGMPPTKITSQNSKVYGKGISAFSTASLKHVVINVTGSGISAPVLFTWDGHDSSGTPPTSFELTVSKGSDRLIQVLAVYQDDSSGGMTFSYGDAKKSLSAAIETVDVVVTALGGSQQSVGGHIAGRYFTSANSGPTGTVSMKFQPGLGKPEMLIEQSLIINGWFQVFGLSNVPLKYELDNKEMLFGGPVSLSNPAFDPNANSGAEWDRLVRAHMPVSVRAESDGTLKPEEAQIYVWGYFGNDVAKADAAWTNRSLCKASVSGSLSRMKVFHATPANWPTQAQLSVNNYINVGLTLPSENVLLDQSNPATSVAFLGGKYDGGACPISPLTASDEFTTYMAIDKELINGNGNDRAGGFRGPFRLDSSGNPFTATFSGNRTLSGTMLPGTDSVISSFRLFKRVSADISYDYHLESPTCNALPSGYVGAGTTNVSGLTFSLTSNISDADANTGVAAILCAARADGTMYNTGIFLGKWVFPSAGGGGASTPVNPATKVKIALHASPGGQVYNQSCVPVDVIPVDNAGNPSYWGNTGGLTFTLTADAGSTTQTFYSTPDCSNQIPAGYGPGTIDNPMRFYYKSLSGSTGSTNLYASTNNLPSYGSAPVSFSNSPGNANYLRFFNYPATSLNAFQCYPLGMQSVIGSSGVIAANPNQGTSIGGNLSTNNSALKFYSNPDCSATNSDSFQTSGPSGIEVTTQYKYFRYESANSGSSPITISAITNWSGTTSAQVLTYPVANIIQPATPTTFKMGVGDTIPWNYCMPFQLTLTDSLGRLSPANSGTFTVTATSSGNLLGVYDSPSCSSGANSISFPGDGVTTSKTAYIKTNAAGATTVTLTASGISMTRNFTVQPEPPTYSFILWPGQIYAANGTSSTPAMPMFVGQTYTGRAVALTSSATLVTNYSSPASFAVSGSAPFAAASPSVMTNGSASFTFSPSYPVSGYQPFSGDVTTPWGLPIFGGFTNPVNFYMMPSNATAVSSQQGSALLSTNVCKPVLLQMYSQTANISEAGRAFNPAFNAGLGGGPLESATPSQVYAAAYTDAACTVALGGGQTVIPTNDSAALIYLKATTASQNATVTLSFINTYAGAGPLAIVSSIATTSTTAGAHTGYNLLGETSIVEGKCQGFALEAVDASGYAVNITDTVTLSGGGMTIYPDATCSTPNNVLTFAGVGAKKFYVRHQSIIGTPMGVGSISWSDTNSHAGSSGLIYILNYLPDP